MSLEAFLARRAYLVSRANISHFCISRLPEANISRRAPRGISSPSSRRCRSKTDTITKLKPHPRCHLCMRMRLSQPSPAEKVPRNEADEESRDVRVWIAAQHTAILTIHSLPLNITLFITHVPQYIKTYTSEILIYLFICVPEHRNT